MKTTSPRSDRSSLRIRVGRAFTLLEILIAVGAVALLAVGISQVFRATGATLRGGKRLSYFNSYAAQIERQLRRDIDSMSRQGPLIIRHELVSGQQNDPNEPVALYKGQPMPAGAASRPGEQRRRRADQMVFFSNGQFTSQRDPVYPGWVPRSSSARIYIGHGLRRDPNDPAQEAFDALKIDNDNTTNPTASPRRLGLKNTAANGLPYANQFASEWILLRHVTLLCRPGETQIDRPVPANRPPNLANNNVWPDSEFQILLQPAAPSVFDVLNSGTVWSRNPVDNQLVRNGAIDTTVPCFGSGIVDIAATDLAQVRRVILTGLRVSSVGNENDALGQASVVPIDTALAADGPTDVEQQWMRELLPAPADPPAGPGQPRARGGRMRCEASPPNLLGAMPPSGNAWPTPAEDYRRCDQQMLSAFNFVPGCSEMIVEWSFGDTDFNTTTEETTLRWRGLPRWDDANGNGTVDGNERNRVFARPYGKNESMLDDLGDQVSAIVPLRNGTGVASVPIAQPVIHGITATLDPTPQVMYSYFGYHLPTFNPDITGNDADGNGIRDDDPGDSSVKTVQWPWPKLIRITMSLVDPNDPTYEQTYQFVFRVPAGNSKSDGDPTIPPM